MAGGYLLRISVLLTRLKNSFNIERMSSKIEELIKEIAQRQTKPVIDASIEQIADEIQKLGNPKPSKSYIWKILHRIGAVASGRKFVYRWKDNHE